MKFAAISVKAFSILFFLFAFVQLNHAAVIYVDLNATGANDGTSWTNAFSNLQDAIDSASDGDRLWVAMGVYVPDRDTSGNVSPSDPRTRAFLMKSGVKLLGGFDGTETVQGQRDWIAHKTYLSGDRGVVNDSTDNCYTVMFVLDTGPGTSINGFFIEEANNDGIAGNGGGMHAQNSVCIFRNNTFLNNTSFYGAGLLSENSELMIASNRFVQNVANHWLDGGAAIFNDDSRDSMVNCLFVANSAEEEAAGIFIDFPSDTNYIVHCTFYDNKSDAGFDAVYANATEKLYIYNSIFWDHNTEISTNGFNDIDLFNCIVQGSVSALINEQNLITANPRFSDPTVNDYELLSCSPGIDAGDSTLFVLEIDFNGDDRIVNNNSDIGAFESTLLPGGFTRTTAHVDSSATGTNDGMSWSNAFPSIPALKGLIQTFDHCLLVDTILLAQGTYPTGMQPDDVLELRDVSLFGGFPAGGGSLASRNPEVYPTKLSGEIGNLNDSTDNVRTLLHFEEIDSTTILDGIEFCGAYGRTGISYDATAIEISGGPIIQHAKFYRNASQYVLESDKADILNCEFYENEGVSVISTLAAGLKKFTNCKFYENTSSTLISSRDTRFVNCLLVNNSAATVISGREIATVINCTFQNYCVKEISSVSLSSDTAQLNIYNSILWSVCLEAVDTSVFDVNILDIRNSMIRGGHPLAMNAVGGKPVFFNTSALDFRMLPCSPGINAGEDTLYIGPATDLNGKNRTHGNIDIGAVELQASPNPGITHRNVYIDHTATGVNDGSSWTDAFTSLDTALNEAYSPSGCFLTDTVFIAQGTYKPRNGVAGSQHFLLSDSLVLFGGYPNGGGERKPGFHKTILSGELGSPVDTADNAKQVVIGTFLSDQTCLDGMIIQDGLADVTGRLGFTGAGLYLLSADPKISNVVFKKNRALVGGGGLYMSNSDPEVTGCLFEQNRAEFGQSAYGAGAYLNSSNPVFNRCKFSNNLSDWGALAFVGTSSPEIDQCVFENNTAYAGGAIYKSQSASGSVIRSSVFHKNTADFGGAIIGYGNLTVLNSLFLNDTAFISGGAAYFDVQSGDTLRFLNCTVTGHTADFGPCMYFEESFPETPGEPQFTNTIFWNGGNEFYNAGLEDVIFTNCLYGGIGLPLGSIDGGGNLFNQDPMFGVLADPDGADNIFGTYDDGLNISAGSPAIAAGLTSVLPPNFNKDLSGKARVYYDTVDIGAYEFPCSPDPSPVLHVNQNAPVDGDGSAWSKPIQELSAALEIARIGGCTVDTILVAEGLYYPSGVDDRTRSFEIPSGATLLGGHGFESGILIGRNPLMYPTILSGDLGVVGDSSDNSFRMITLDQLIDDTTLDGFVIRHAVDSLGSAVYLPPMPGIARLFLTNVKVNEHRSPRPIYTTERLVLNNVRVEDNQNNSGRGVGLLNVGANVLVIDSMFDNPSSNGQHPRELQNLSDGVLRIRGNVLLKGGL